MSRPEPVICWEMLRIQKIIEDETWLEGERRHCWVSPDDPVVRENVCRVILRIGQELRDAFAAELAVPAGQTRRVRAA